MKIFTDKAWKKWNDELDTKKKWIAFNAAEFTRCVGWYTEAIRHPGFYKDGSDVKFAKMALDQYAELFKLDEGSAKMVSGVTSYEIGQMIDTLKNNGEDVKKYYKIL